MNVRSTLLFVLVLCAAFALPSEVHSQYAKNTNKSRRDRSVLVGGTANLIPSNTIAAFIGGGQGNTASSAYATVVGGDDNTGSGQFAAVGGGYENNATGTYYSTVAGGHTNTASGTASTVSGGERNKASGEWAAVGGGYGNTASGDRATVPGGRNAFAIHADSFVWGADADSTTASFASNSFTVRASGGARFISTTNSGVSLTNTPNNGVFLAPGANSWAALSDSNAKTTIRRVDPRTILRKVAALPVTEWQYKGQPERNYIGPMAQDFHAAFGLGYDDKSIATADTDGVMYAAIKGLVEELKERDKAMAARDKTIEELKLKSAELDSLRTEFHRLREHLEKTLPPAP